MREDLISIIVPVYNVEKYLEECVDSIINQTYKNLEIILVDDGSTDNSGKICDEYKEKDNRIVVIHKKNGGLSSARNEGMKYAKGAYLQFVDSDDYMDNDMVEMLYNMIITESADISMCSHYILKNGNIYSDATNGKYVFSNEEALEELLLDRTIRFYAWNKLFRKELFEDVCYPEGRLFEDILAMPEVFAKAKKIAFEDVPKYYYRQREGSILHKQTIKLGIDYIEAVLDMEEYLRKLPYKLDKYIDYNCAVLTINTFNNAGIFDLPGLADEPIVNELYEKLKKMSQDKEFEKFFLENISNAKKIHYYFILEDKANYIKYNKCLPLMYPEQEKNKK